MKSSERQVFPSFNFYLLFGVKSKEIKKKRKKVNGIVFTINSELNGKYDNEPFFKEKVEKANEILKKAGVPKF